MSKIYEPLVWTPWSSSNETDLVCNNDKMQGHGEEKYAKEIGGRRVSEKGYDVVRPDGSFAEVKSIIKDGDSFTAGANGRKAIAESFAEIVKISIEIKKVYNILVNSPGYLLVLNEFHPDYFPYIKRYVESTMEKIYEGEISFSALGLIKSKKWSGLLQTMSMCRDITTWYDWYSVNRSIFNDSIIERLMRDCKPSKVYDKANGGIVLVSRNNLGYIEIPYYRLDEEFEFCGISKHNPKFRKKRKKIADGEKVEVLNDRESGLHISPGHDVQRSSEDIQQENTEVQG